VQKNRKSGTFAHVLERLREEKGMKTSLLYTKAGITKQYYSKLMTNGKSLNISKRYAIAFGLALKLNRTEMDELLLSAGFALSNYSNYDLLIIFCIENRIYDIDQFESLLKKEDRKDVYTGNIDELGELTDEDEDEDSEHEDSEYAEGLEDILNNLADNLDNFGNELPDLDIDDIDDEFNDLSDEEKERIAKVTNAITTPLIDVLDGFMDIFNKAKDKIDGLDTGGGDTESENCDENGYKQNNTNNNKGE
jgi:transcriptional regulator with XRE-family HTH domain